MKCAFSALLGKVFREIALEEDLIIFRCVDGEEYRLLHQPECCERVMLVDIAGDLADLIGSPILQAEQVSSHEHPPGVELDSIVDESEIYTFTWTFYKLATIKGSVTIRWYGQSNGHYSEEATLFRIS